MGKSVTIKYCERGATELSTEKVMAGGLIASSYRGAKAGSKSFLFETSLMTRLVALYYKSPFSRFHIGKAIKNYNIDVSEFRDSVKSFGNFNAFFTRRLKPGARPHDQSPDVLVSPADGKILVYPQLSAETLVPVKGAKFSMSELFDRVGREYKDGAAAVIRLCPGDYHRFHFPCGGDVVETKDIRGKYHSVSPIALESGADIFCKNKRSYSIIKSKYFGRFSFMEVGAFGVGSIVQTYSGKSAIKMREKGYFQYGGSTIILVFEPGKVQFSSDLLSISEQGYETRVLVGQEIGKALVSEGAGA